METSGLDLREKEFQNQKTKDFPLTKLCGSSLDFYQPRRESILTGLLSPWPLKMGEPTLSVMRFHDKSCHFIAGEPGKKAGEYVCKCKRFLSMLRAGLKEPRTAKPAAAPVRIVPERAASIPAALFNPNAFTVVQTSTQGA